MKHSAKKPTILSRSIAFALSLPIVASTSQQASAATYFWDTTTTGSWNTLTNWWTTAGGTTNPTVIPSAADTLTFNGTAVNGATISQLDANYSITGMVFNNTGTTLIDSNSATTRVLTLGTGGITVASGAGAVTIGDATNVTNITLGATQTWTNNSTTNALTVVNGLTMAANPLIFAGAGAFNLNGVISGTVATGTTALTIGTGAGSGTTVTLGNTANSFTGNIAVNGGTLISAYASAAGATSFLGGQIGTVYRTISLTNGGTYQNTATFKECLNKAA